jgi:hypothetical protein
LWGLHILKSSQLLSWSHFYLDELQHLLTCMFLVVVVVIIIIIIIILVQIIWSKSEEVERDWRKLHVVELRVLYFSADTSRATKRSRTRWAGHVACMEGTEMNGRE